MKTVITMTSWKGRINSAGFAIYRFMNTQTVRPDIFYLWLSEDEFPGKEKDLPKELNLVCRYFNVCIKWVKLNEYCHKRWYVYPTHVNDLVISIDDDVFYDSTLIQTAQQYATEYANTIINIGTPEYHPITFNNGTERIFGKYTFDTPAQNFQLCGQCIVLPNSFPVEVMQPEYIIKRNKYCRKCDESFLTPFLVKNGTKIIIHKWDNCVDQDLQLNAISNVMKSKKDLQIYLVLRVFPECMASWKRTYPGYNTKNYDALPIDKILPLL